jgi:glyoxylase-like metal-dependent hydrolase (beta-lactamase superfamily II)
MHSKTLGDFELSVISDGTYPLDGGAFFGVVPKSLWSRRVQADEKNLIYAGTNSLLIRTGKRTVLVETGIGNKLSEKMIKIYGQPAELLENLAAAGVRPEEIDVVINSHLHFDHCGWNTVRMGESVVATFPNAKYYVQRGEWNYAQKPSERDAISYLTDNYDPLVKSGQMELIEGSREIVPGVRVEEFPGHTAHMQAVIVESAGQTACYISDLIPTSAHVDLVWGMAFDLYPLETIASRKRYYERSLPGKWLTVFTHDHQVPWAYVERDEKGKFSARAPA